MVLRLGSVDFFEKEEVDQQAVDEEIVDPQAVKKQDAGQDRDRHDSGPDDFGEGAPPLCHPGEPGHHRRKEGEHRPADDEGPAVYAAGEGGCGVVGEQHPHAEGENVPMAAFWVGLYMAISVPRRIQTAIWEKMSPRVGA